MRHYHMNKHARHNPVINIDNVWRLVSQENRDKALAANKDNVPVIDVTKAGYFKVLGKGNLPKLPVIVKAKFFSRRAEEKIKKVGGACLLTA